MKVGPLAMLLLFLQYRGQDSPVSLVNPAVPPAPSTTSDRRLKYLEVRLESLNMGVNLHKSLILKRQSRAAMQIRDSFAQHLVQEPDVDSGCNDKLIAAISPETGSA